MTAIDDAHACAYVANAPLLNIKKETIVKIKTNANGSKCWYLNDQRHRENGPAIEYANGSKSWYRNGKLHREDGPAVELADGFKAWYLKGQAINCSSQQEFNEKVNGKK